MPISKTISGLKLFSEWDIDLDGWTISQSNPSHPSSYVIDTNDKYSGAASIRVIPQQAGTDGYLKRTMTPTGGWKIYFYHKCANASGNYAFRGFSDWQGCYLGVHEGSGAWSEGWTRHSGTIAANVLTELWANWLSSSGDSNVAARVDRLVIYTSLNITITSLTPGQKVELYRASDNTKLDTQTCQAGQSSVVLVIAASEDVPEQMYLKVYATDGSTLVETTSSYDFCGGDTWDWTAGAGTLTISVDADVIYRSAATGTPKTCNVTANLKTLGGANYPGASIAFSTALGSVSPSSDTTDGSGNAHTALTSSSHGIAVVMAQWLGDASVPACSAYYVVHVFYETEAADSSKDYQFFIEGIEYAFVVGHYNLNEIGAPNDFEVEISEWISTITPNGLVNIYRLGIKEFHGILTGIKRSLASDRVVLRGPDVAKLLDSRTADLKVYSAKTAQYIINDLLTAFPCGIHTGSLGSCPDELTITIDTESLLKAIPRICDLVGWHYRVNLDRTLDFAESFTGGTAAASFTEGDNLIDAPRDIDYLPVANKIRMKGDGIYSTKQDGTKIQQQGLHEAPAFNKSISDQATLDAACQALLDMKKTEDETIPLKAWDEYDPGTFGPEDYVTVTAPSVDLSGLYQIRKITRDMTDAQYVELDLNNRTKAYWELDEEYRRMTKDANT